MTRQANGLTRRERVRRGAGLAAFAAFPFLEHASGAAARVGIDPRLKALDQGRSRPRAHARQADVRRRAPRRSTPLQRRPAARGRAAARREGREPRRALGAADGRAHRRALGRPQLRAATRRRSGVVVDLSRLAGVRVAADRAVVGPARGSATIYNALGATGSRSRPAPAPASASAATRSAAASGSPRARGGSPPTTSSRSQIVTADGKVLVADKTHHSDLFWACRGGGGGNFGIVTQLIFRTHPVTQGSYFIASWPWAQVEQVLASFLALGAARARRARLALPARRRAGRADGAGVRPVPRQRDAS